MQRGLVRHVVATWWLEVMRLRMEVMLSIQLLQELLAHWYILASASLPWRFVGIPESIYVGLILHNWGSCSSAAVPTVLSLSK